MYTLIFVILIGGQMQDVDTLRGMPSFEQCKFTADLYTTALKHDYGEQAELFYRCKEVVTI